MSREIRVVNIMRIRSLCFIRLKVHSHVQKTIELITLHFKALGRSKVNGLQAQVFKKMNLVFSNHASLPFVGTEHSVPQPARCSMRVVQTNSSFLFQDGAQTRPL